ncbi:LysM peptidoglycan-binding domain-containing protein [Phyllobacterium salinisoli]|uniref:LysM peptidoglycan-binding domain-containing protein n=2 Tax=Phyllobacterium salinisoli TaxID=1899321 RepID=A0A368K4T9_9HYPH|nr:LysM peptidoglycan-binding domain-containing M23 family metallopeptidase [Phyllobacterium salinisoli]RCS24241.1 LysM peptidoglycan-binding domain-containing protein [Phyllobacterium salinisoli]
MRFRVLDQTSQRLLRNAAIILIAGFGAGCSADTMRFTDGIYTGSTSNQRSMLSRPTAQPYPQAAASAAPVDGGYTGSVNRGAVTPVTQSAAVQRNSLPPVSSAPVASASSQPVPVAAEPKVVRPVAAEQQIASATPVAPGGVSHVVVQPGESLFGIARRTGVSPNAIMQANGITDANRIQAGQKLKVPGQGQVTAGGGVVAANGTRTAGQVTGQGQPEKVLGQLPQNPHAPTQRPANSDVAILPQTPAVKEKQHGAIASAATTSTTTTPPAPGGSYTVQSGDSLYSISQKTGAPVEAIKKANGLANGAIRVGQNLVIPGAAGRATQVASAPKVDQVKTGSTPPATQPVASGAKPYTPPQANNKVIEDAEKNVASAPTSTGISQMRWPARGRVLSSFGQRDGGTVNDGIDIMVPEGTPVKAAENGVVIYAGDGLKEFGNTVLVRHENGLVTVYGHNSKILVQRGQKVRRGEEIARSGMSGNAKSPKLHFEVRKNSSPVNPTKYLES